MRAIGLKAVDKMGNGRYKKWPEMSLTCANINIWLWVKSFFVFILSKAPPETSTSIEFE